MTTSRESRAPSILSLCNPDHGFLLLLLLLHTSSPASAQSPNPPPKLDPITEVRFDKSMATILVILVVVFLAIGFVSVCTRQCAERRFGGTNHLNPFGNNSDRHPRGLDPEIIRTFPTFVYSTVKGFKIGRNTLECAVCLNEFLDHETLRFIPKCSHVFHPQCIDLWLSSHFTCPVCRANLAPSPGDISFVSVDVQIPDWASEPDTRPESEEQHTRDIIQLDQENSNRVGDSSPKNRDVINKIDRNLNPSPRSRSTGFRIVNLFPRSHSTGHSLISQRENSERFTLRLPEEVRKELLTPTRKSPVTFTRMGSERRGYRTRSVGSGGGANYLQHERFRRDGRSDRWGFTWTPPFINRSGSSSSRKPPADSSEVAKDNLGERSTDRLCPEQED